MNSELKVIRKTLISNEVTEFDLEIPSYEVIVKNLTDGCIYVYCGESASGFNTDKSIKINANMGQLVFMNNKYNLEFSFDKLYIKSESGGEVELQIIGF